MSETTESESLAILYNSIFAHTYESGSWPNRNNQTCQSTESYSVFGQINQLSFICIEFLVLKNCHNTVQRNWRYQMKTHKSTILEGSLVAAPELKPVYQLKKPTKLQKPRRVCLLLTGEFKTSIICIINKTQEWDNLHSYNPLRPSSSSHKTILISKKKKKK